jgi:putative Mn2+ efflux pump MntP
MFGTLSVVSMGLGSMLGFAAKWYPSRTEALEICAGALLLTGLGLLGSALPHLV